MKKLFQKPLCCFLALAMAASLVACETGSSPTSPSAASEGSKSVKTLTLLMYTDWYKTGWEALEKYINENSEKVGFKLDIQKIAGGAQGDQVVETKFLSDDLPDIIEEHSPLWIQSYASGLSRLVPLNGLNSVAEYDPDTIKNVYTLDGKLYGMPIDVAVVRSCFFYNRKAFKTAGISTVPKTWDELLTDCDKLKAKGITPVYFSGKDGWTTYTGLPMIGFAENIIKSGKPFKDYMNDINTNQKKYAQMEELVSRFAQSKSLIDKGFVNPTYLSDTYDNAQKALADGKAGMYSLGTWVLDQIESKYPDKIDDIGIFPVPGANDAVIYDDPYSLSLTDKCSDTELGKKAIDFIASKEAQQIYADAQPGLYLNKNVKSGKLCEAYQEAKRMMESDRAVMDVQNFVGHSWGNLAQYLMSYYTGSYKSADEVAKAMDSETAKNAKSKGDPNWK
jgi:raffinose/stachyose/melibiose transport system substrate-binding protein